MTVTEQTRRVFRAERTLLCEDDSTRVQVRTFFVEPAAWLWVARASLFAARAARCQCKRIEREYRGSPAMDGGPGQCRLCDREQWRPAVERLARILRARSNRKANP